MEVPQLPIALQEAAFTEAADLYAAMLPDTEVHPQTCCQTDGCGPLWSRCTAMHELSAKAETILVLIVELPLLDLMVSDWLGWP